MCCLTTRRRGARQMLSETGHSQFVVGEVRAAVGRSEVERSRLALWSRRLLGEAITQAQYAGPARRAGRPGGGRTRRSGPHDGEFFERLQRTHGARMVELGLA